MLISAISAKAATLSETIDGFFKPIVDDYLIPVIFWDPKRVNILKSAQPYLDDLRRVNILHDTPESAAKLVNEIYEDPMSWWMSDKVQEVKNEFCHRFARTSEAWLQEWKSELLKLNGD